MELIDRDKVLNFIDCEHLSSATKKCFSELDVINLLEEQPTVDAKPVVHGRWKNGDGIYDTCTACGEEIYQAFEMYYCPNCGADMRG